MGKSREIALEILNGVFRDNSYSNIILSNYLNKTDLQNKDKALVTEIVYGTIKYKYTIDKILSFFIKKELKTLDIDVLDILRLTVYQVKYLDKIPEFAAVNEAVEITKKRCSIGASKFVNGVLRNYLRNKSAAFVKTNNEIDKLAYDYSFEPWMVKLFLKQYGKAAAIKILQGLNEIPSVSVRVNNLKGTYDYVFEKLEDSGYSVKEGYICPEAIQITKGRNIEDNELFKKGFITVQDESAMLVASAMDLKESMTVLDLCSAPGGKTTHIAEIMNDKGIVRAYDLHENKLRLIKENSGRLGINNIICGQMDSSVFNPELKAAADRILLDVPCSGLGIIRKKPEIKYTKAAKDISKIIEIQRSIMKNAARYIKNDGIMIYSTCTLNKEENEENVKWFLNNYPEFKAQRINFGVCENIVYNKDNTVTILPNKYMDGFFICKLKNMAGVQ